MCIISKYIPSKQDMMHYMLFCSNINLRCCSHIQKRSSSIGQKGRSATKMLPWQLCSLNEASQLGEFHCCRGATRGTQRAHHKKNHHGSTQQLTFRFRLKSTFLVILVKTMAMNANEALSLLQSMFDVSISRSHVYRLSLSHSFF